MPASEESLALLRSINASLQAIDASLKFLVKQRQATAPKAVASDRDLDGKYGDPVLKFMPRDWTGASYKNCRFSQCPPDLLEIVADTFDYFARQAEENNERTDRGKPVAEFKRADAARARGWAKRMRDGVHQVPSTDTDSEFAGAGDTW